MFWHMAGKVKTLISLNFLKVFRYSGVLGGLLGHLGDHVRRLWRARAKKFWKVAGKMREVRPRWQQVAPKMGHDGVKMAIFWGHLGCKMDDLGRVRGAFWRHFTTWLGE